ncbi:hypothetical protein PSR1_03515 [Anaeromyxobacter sp. PSR-1]|nr:hypothetical protein PSR1_03515 [Anaeromyxobacter sp. PSR-1]
MGCWEASNTPVPSGLCANAARSAARSNGAAGVLPLTLICMMVRVFGPKPGGVDGAPPVEVRSALPV